MMLLDITGRRCNTIGPRALEKYEGDRAMINFQTGHGSRHGYTKGSIELNENGDWCLRDCKTEGYIPLRHGESIRIHPAGKEIGMCDFVYIDSSD